MSADKKEDKAEEGQPVEGAAAEGAEAAPKKKSKLKLILMIAIPLVLILGGAAGAYFMGYIGKHEVPCDQVKEGDENYEKCAKELAEKANSDAPGTFIDIPDMIVNLSSASKQPRFLKISLKIELEKAEEQKAFEDAKPRVIDQFQTYLRELRVEDLRGSSGMYRMKIELLNRVRAAVPSVHVRDVLFQEILIQ